MADPLNKPSGLDDVAINGGLPAHLGSSARRLLKKKTRSFN